MQNDPTGRALQLLSLLQSRRRWVGAELADRLQVTERTIRRDVERLRDLGYPVEAAPGNDGGYRLAAGTHLPPLVFDDEEAVAVAVGLRAAAGAAIEGFDDTSIRALAKIEQVLPDRLRRRVAALQATVVSLGRPAGDDVVDPDALGVLATACRDHEEVRFDYRRGDDEGQGDQDADRRLVEPHQLVSAGRRWYLIAWDLRRGDWRTFRLDRLTDARLAGRRFAPRPIPGGDGAAYFAASIAAISPDIEALVAVDGAYDLIAPALAGTDHTVVEHNVVEHNVVEHNVGSCLLRLRADTVGALHTAVVRLALERPVQILDAPRSIG
ncbi:MAG: YafY family protein [Actinomycetota bacterium]